MFYSVVVGIILGIVASANIARITGNIFKLSGKNVFKGVLR